VYGIMMLLQSIAFNTLCLTVPGTRQPNPGSALGFVADPPVAVASMCPLAGQEEHLSRESTTGNCPPPLAWAMAASSRLSQGGSKASGSTPQGGGQSSQRRSRGSSEAHASSGGEWEGQRWRLRARGFSGEGWRRGRDPATQDSGTPAASPAIEPAQPQASGGASLPTTPNPPAASPGTRQAQEPGREGGTAARYARCG